MAVGKSTNNNNVVFDDFFPTMMKKLGAEGFMEELYNGFQLLMDEESGMITLESLRRNLAVLGLGNMSEEEIRGMLSVGDLDGDGCLTQMEFCVLMFRLSPGLMEGSWWLLQHVLGEL